MRRTLHEPAYVATAREGQRRHLSPLTAARADAIAFTPIISWIFEAVISGIGLFPRTSLAADDGSILLRRRSLGSSRKIAILMVLYDSREYRPTVRTVYTSSRTYCRPCKNASCNGGHKKILPPASHDGVQH